MLFVYEKATLFLVTHTEPLKFKKEIEELNEEEEVTVDEQ